MRRRRLQRRAHPGEAQATESQAVRRRRSQRRAHPGEGQATESQAVCQELSVDRGQAVQRRPSGSTGAKRCARSGASTGTSAQQGPSGSTEAKRFNGGQAVDETSVLPSCPPSRDGGQVPDTSDGLVYTGRSTQAIPDLQAEVSTDLRGPTSREG